MFLKSILITEDDFTGYRIAVEEIPETDPVEYDFIEIAKGNTIKHGVDDDADIFQTDRSLQLSERILNCPEYLADSYQTLLARNLSACRKCLTVTYIENDEEENMLLDDYIIAGKDTSLIIKATDNGAFL